MICPEDRVVDYMVMEAVAIKVAQEDKEAREKAEDEKEREAFKNDRSELESLVYEKIE